MNIVAKMVKGCWKTEFSWEITKIKTAEPSLLISREKFSAKKFHQPTPCHILSNDRSSLGVNSYFKSKPLVTSLKIHWDFDPCL